MELEKIQNNEKKRILIAVLGIIAIAIAAFATYKLTDKKENKDPYKPNEVKTSDLDYSFLKLEDDNKNMIYSPLSIKYALSMLNEGASGKTKEEITKVLGNYDLTKYENIDKILSLANSIFVRDIYKKYISQDYVQILKDKYNAEVIYDAFKDAEKVNKWIEDKTFGIIKNMLQDEIVQNPDTKILLVNALAIDMAWYYRFENENTHKATFTVGDKTLDVAMMNMALKSDVIKYFVDDEFTSVVLPFQEYEGVQLEFVAVMPNSDLHKFVTSDEFETKLNNVLSNLKTNSEAKFSISLPRFEFNKGLNLTTDLQKLGVELAFSTSADFTKMGSTPLYVSDVLHKADIKLSERGIKAAAATVIMMKDSAFLEPDQIETIQLNFDKPFVFLIRDAKTGEIWFVGDVYEPVLWENVKDNY